MPKSLKNSMNNVKKALNNVKKAFKNSTLALALATVLSSCGGDPSAMSFERDTQSGKMSITYVGREWKEFDIEITKLEDWNYQGEIDERGRWFNKQYSGTLDAIIDEMISDMQDQVWKVWISSTSSGELLEERTSEKFIAFKEAYEKFLENKHLDKQEIKYSPNK